MDTGLWILHNGGYDCSSEKHYLQRIRMCTLQP
jgi:hypothetical protein